MALTENEGKGGNTASEFEEVVNTPKRPKKWLEIDSDAFEHHCQGVRSLVFEYIWEKGNTETRLKDHERVALKEILEFTFTKQKEVYKK
ncbi:hypothetical protein [Leptospira phage LE3]|uniref:Uncharacterized protein n=1 Tax=Leptospira phage LE3 TaxID=2041382 RepID=A0A343LE24_9CAUD|nr:hypothetical protein HWB33_gp60 [Leptospira phage LE3]ATN94934.1 hypothetical protein [Leptospira phage LE3]